MDIDIKQQQKKLKENIERLRGNIDKLRPKHYKAKFAVALVVLALTVIGFNTQYFISSGLFNSTSHAAGQIELNSLHTSTLERVGFDVQEFENDINQIIAEMNNAQQGAHFLLGMIMGLVFSAPAAGLTVGIVKEGYDLVTNYLAGTLNHGYLVDALVDTGFWFAGGFVGFYILSALHDIFYINNINGPKDLIAYLSKKTFFKNN